MPSQLDPRRPVSIDRRRPHPSGRACVPRIRGHAASLQHLALPLRPLAALWFLRARVPERGVESAERSARGVPAARPGGVWIHGSSVGEARVVTAARAVRSREPEAGAPGFGLLPDPDRAWPAPGRPAGRCGVLPAAGLQGLPGPGSRRDETVGPGDRRDRTVAQPGHRGSHRRGGRGDGQRAARAGTNEPVPSTACTVRTGAAAGRGPRRPVGRRRRPFCRAGRSPEVIVVTGNVKYDLPPPRLSRESLLGRSVCPRNVPWSLPDRPGPERTAPFSTPLPACGGTTPSSSSSWLRATPSERTTSSEKRRRAGSRFTVSPRTTTAPRRQPTCSSWTPWARLAALYGLARVAFVGGSLVHIGGHNVLEPAAAGVPVVFGPHTHHFAEPVTALLRAGGGIRVRDGDELARVWIEMVGDARRAETVARTPPPSSSRNRGALERSIDLVLGSLAGDVLRGEIRT